MTLEHLVLEMSLIAGVVIGIAVRGYLDERRAAAGPGDDESDTDEWVEVEDQNGTRRVRG